MLSNSEARIELNRVKRMVDQLTDKRSATALTAYADDLQHAISLEEKQSSRSKIVI